MKKIWITSLAHDQERVQKIMALLKTYAVDADGHFWEDDLQKMAWMGPREHLSDQDTAAWVILWDAEAMATESIRFGLAMLALSVQSIRGHGYPILLVHADQTLLPGELPTPLQGTEVMSETNPAFGARIVALANMPLKKLAAEYRLDVYALPQLGIWFEIGPVDTEWKGAMFGVAGDEINAHGVGPAGKLPQKAVLEYPMQGLELSLADTQYMAWAVQNRLDDATSYYVKVNGQPDAIVLGPLAEGDDAEAYVLRLK